MMGVGDRHSECVGAVGASDFHARQQAADHGMDLDFIGVAISDHRFLDQACGIFVDGYAAAGRGEQHDAAGLAQLQRRLRILVDEHLLDRGGLYEMHGEHLAKRIVQHDQSLRQRFLGIGPELAIGDMAQPVPFGGNDAPAGAAEPGIEADQDQASFSITSSETS
jgi:hypothetical protein